MTQILDGKAAAAEIRAELAASVRELAAAGARLPQLVAVLVGDNPASQTYVGSKVRGCAEVGLLSRTLRLPAETSEAELLALVDDLNADDAVDGILVQLPLPAQIHEKRVLDRISPEKDVDGFHPVSVGRLWLDQEGFTPATPTGIVALLKRSGIPLAGRRAVVVGRSAIVGKPMAGLLLRESCTVTVCHSRTVDLAAVTREADILVAAIGRPAMIGPDHVRDGAVVVDVGMSRLADAAETERLFPGDAERREQVAQKGYTLVGDVDFTRVAPKASHITPVPGGVGPLTVAMVLFNTLKAARRRQGLSDLPIAP
ncbi:MAG: bifunctional methylenetetrahydrofolate dehydrogenase/methenyltetrahydrofolate cyclohydrolase [Acidobacteria bacterium]|nr:bifunctional methylenetetrahydrofolate dehydrogenase/methenyltetrahydrofolate cyclohydrolase [Acidobacteriota bacterium]